MNWTKEKPKEEGWYFYRIIDEDRPDLKLSIMEIYYSILDMMTGKQNPTMYYRTFAQGEGSPFIDFEDCEWYGPLKPPEEEESTHEEWKELKQKMAIEAIIMDFGDIMIPVAEARQMAEETLKSGNQDALNVEYRMGQALIILKKMRGQP